MCDLTRIVSLTSNKTKTEEKNKFLQINPSQQKNRKRKTTPPPTKEHCFVFITPIPNMSLTFGCTRQTLDFLAIALLSFFITSGCCINWQENVRPKLYVELGKLIASKS